MNTVLSALQDHFFLEDWWIYVIYVAASLGVSSYLHQRNAKQEPEICLVWRALLMIYLGIVAVVTFVGRSTMNEHHAAWMPFWSWYEVIVNGRVSLFEEIVLNILMLAPAGGLLYLLYQLRLRQVFWIGLTISAVIEVSQFVFMRGLFEWDDMIHNSLGCVLGAAFVRWLVNIWSAQLKFENKIPDIR